MKRFIITLAVLIFAASGLQAQDWAKAKLAKSPRHQEWVKIKHDSREVQCFLVYPEVKDKATTIVLIHEIFGLTDWACEMADELAGEGYIVIAPDLLTGSATNGGGTEELIKSGGNVGKAIMDAARSNHCRLEGGGGLRSQNFRGQRQNRRCWILLGRRTIVPFRDEQQKREGRVCVLRHAAGQR